MTNLPARGLSRHLPALATAAALCCLAAAHPSRAADESDAPKGASVTVLKADAAGIESVESLRENLTMRSLNDIMIDAAAPAGAGLSR